MDFAEWAAQAPRGRVIVLDIDGTLVPAGSAAVEARVLRAVLSLKEGNTVYLFSNKGLAQRDARLSAMLDIPLIESPYRKPDPRVIAHLPLGVMVVGDKWLTDGLLAWRAGGEYVRVSRVADADEPWSDRWRNALDDIVGEMWHLLVALRPKQWLKNVLVFAPLFFARELPVPHAARAAAAAFVAFCLVSSATYIINDLRDLEADRLHPTKRRRSLASGRITVSSAVALSIGLLLGSGLLMWLLAPAALPFLALYAVSSVVYSTWLKRVAVAEMLAFIWFYYARILVGGAAAAVALSSWLSLSIVFLALFLVLGKRNAELREGRPREVLAAYSVEFLHGMLFMSAGLVVAFYALYTVLGTPSALMVYSTLPVLAGVTRYLQLAFTHEGAEAPDELLFKDPGLIASAAVWLAVVAAVFY